MERRNYRALLAFQLLGLVWWAGKWRSMGGRFDGLVVLIVEDDWLVREDLAAGLRQEGWTVLEADTGGGALRVLREAQTVDLLITDIGLADAVTGWDVAEAFRASNPEIPVIFASGNPNEERRQVAESAFLSKPVVISELLATCRKVLETDGREFAGLPVS
jgi:CheY-like chemotaxis protein